jgi:hypothetical protein
MSGGERIRFQEALENGKGVRPGRDTWLREREVVLSWASSSARLKLSSQLEDVLQSLHALRM